MLIIMIYLVKNAGFPQLREVTKGFFFNRFAGTRSDGELPGFPPSSVCWFLFTRLTRFYITIFFPS